MKWRLEIWLTVLLMAFCAAVHADDIDIYLPEAQSSGLTGQPQVLIIFDNSGSMAQSSDGKSYGKSRLSIAQQAIDNLVAANPGINFGLALFNYNGAESCGWNCIKQLNNGGRIVQGLPSAGTQGEESRSDLFKTIAGISANGSTPLCETMYEAYQYFTGGELVYGTKARQDDLPERDQTIESQGRYLRPLRACESVYVIYMTDGKPQYDTDANQRIKELPGVGSCKSYANEGDGYAENCLPELTQYMHDNDLAPDLPGEQHAYTYTIGFTTDQALLEDAAAPPPGDGETTPKGYYTADDADQLSSAFSNIVTEIVAHTTPYATPVVTASTLTQTQSIDSVYLPRFLPESQGRWSGNLKKLGIDANGVLVDANNQPAIDSSTGDIKASAQGLWSDSKARGNQVEEGGAGSLLVQRGYASRTIWSNLDGADLLRNVADVASSDSDSLFDETSRQAITAANYTSKNVIDWLRGRDIRDEDSDGRTDDTRPWIMGDIIHSLPAAVNYGCGSNEDCSGTEADRNVRLFFGTNEGVLHAINGSTGAEEWAFWPHEMADVAVAQMLNTTMQYQLPISNEGDADKESSSWQSLVTQDCGKTPSSSCLNQAIAIKEAGQYQLFSQPVEINERCQIGTDGILNGNSFAYTPGFLDTEFFSNFRVSSALLNSKHNKNEQIFCSCDDFFLLKSTCKSYLSQSSSPIATLGYLQKNASNDDTTAVTYTQGKTYGVDGKVSYITLDNNGDGQITHDDKSDDKALIAFGFRRGGYAYYGLDVTDRDGPPSIAWHIDTQTPGFAQMGQTWSTPAPARLNPLREVFMFGGGYAIAKDANGMGIDDTRGNAFYVIDAFSGERLWSALGPVGDDATSADDSIYRATSLVDSVPADVAAVDTDFDGYTDSAFFGDTGGNVWMADMRASEPSGWKLLKIAELGRHSDEQDEGKDRRFFNRPDFVQTYLGGKPIDLLIIGSGDRAHPKRTDIQDKIFILNVTPFVEGSGSTGIDSLTSDDLIDVPMAGNDGATATLSLASVTEQLTKGEMLDFSVQDTRFHGWEILLDDKGRKVLSDAQTVYGTTLFTAYQPPDTEADNYDMCTAAQGSSYLYAFTLPRLEFNGRRYSEDKDSGKITSEKAGDYLLGTPSLYVGSNGIQVLGAGTADTSGIVSSDGIKQVWPTYWYQKN